ncbi:MAG: polyprenol monophosphomannose synthase [Bacteroidetes bacterium]|nr:polyprenol monophosphomannose synthase [Bacteroidota bacterium]
MPTYSASPLFFVPKYHLLSKNLVIVPTYLELENVGRMIDAVLSLPVPFHILVVDDGSPDGTAEVVKTKRQQHPESVHLLERSGKLGLGTAYITGFYWGLERGYDYIFEMDCDFSHNPTDLVRLLKTLENGADLVVGSRYVRGGKCVNWPADRQILSYGASFYVRLITWMWVKDPTAGFVGFRRKVLETIDLDKIKFIGYAFQIEMKFAAWVLGFKIKEIPITFTDRIEGTSKMSKGIIKEAVWGVVQMKWWSLTGSLKHAERRAKIVKNEASQRSI